jgi:hypothetical protein
MGTVSEHAVHLDLEKLRVPEGHFLRKLPAVGALVAVVGVVACAAMVVMGGEESRRQFFFSYLVAYAFFASIAVGGLFFVLVNLLTSAGWSVTLRRGAENAAGTLPLLALMFVPLAFGLHDLYQWTDEAIVAHDPILQHKHAYLNIGFFAVRAVLILGGWAFMGWWFRRESVLQDTAGERDVSFAGMRTTSTRRLRKAAGPAMYAFALTTSFAAFDWIMSLEPHWYSTIFGGYFFAGTVVAIMALLILVNNALQGTGLLGDAVTDEHYHDLGKYLFGFVVFWGYMAFSQFLLIWYANIPEETAWYHQRAEGSWMLASRVILFGHFLIPFFFFIPRTIKRARPLLFLGAGYMLLIHLADIHWLVMPTLHHDGMHASLMDLAALLVVGGGFVAALSWNMTHSALVPLKDPRLAEAVAFENF